jgi:hypothetical protein
LIGSEAGIGREYVRSVRPSEAVALSVEPVLRRRVIVEGSSAGTGAVMMIVTGGGAGATTAG